MSMLSDAALKPLREVDWSNLDEVNRVSNDFLVWIANQADLLPDLVKSVKTNPSLFALCEHYDILDKIVLHEDKSGFRLRLHLFGEGYFDRPHNHRWIYTTRLISGSYKHKVFLISSSSHGKDAMPRLDPIMNRRESVGDGYTLNTNVAHSIEACPGTVSIILRGPAVADRFIVTDRVTGRAWWQYGAANETAAERDAKRMSAERFAMLENRLYEMSILT